MKKQLILPLAAFLLLLPFASAFEGSFFFTSVGYGRGWPPYTCLAEHGIVPSSGLYPGDLGQLPGCLIGGKKIPVNTFYGLSQEEELSLSCPFEGAAISSGYRCSPDAQANVLSPFVIVDVTIPEDVKLVTSDGFVLNTVANPEVCPGEKISVKTGEKSGEWWTKGGPHDSPPIYWVNDTVEFVKQVMKYHREKITNLNTITTKENFRSNYTDTMFNIPIYSSLPRLTLSSNRSSLATPVNQQDEQNINIVGTPAGNFVCSLKKIGSNQAGDTLSLGKTVDLEFDILCSFYYFAGPGAGGNIILRQPTIIQATGATSGAGAFGRAFGLHNVIYQKIDDLFKVGTIKLNKQLKVVQPTKAKLAVSAIPSQAKAADGRDTVKIVLKNSGTGTAFIENINAGAGSEVLFCDNKEIVSGKNIECVAAVSGNRPGFTIKYTETSCGKSLGNQISFQLGGVVKGVPEQQPVTVKENNIGNSCSSDFACGSGVCCAGLCRDQNTGVCDDIDGDGVADTWVPN